MMKPFLRTTIACCSVMLVASSCKDQVYNDLNVDVDRVAIDKLSPEMQKVRDYVPKFAVIAHRGSTFWTPEETESAYRWAREIGADYLECDMQVTKDGVVLALHDDNLSRTTNIEQVFGQDLPKVRYDYYLALGYSPAEAQAKYDADKKAFIPLLTNYYTFQELQMLDAGSWFNTASPNEARGSFSAQRQYISALEDLVMYARGKRLKRDAAGARIYTLVRKTGATISGLSGASDVVEYKLEYEDDPQDTGHRPGIYIEFKEPWLNPGNFEKIVYDELDRLGMNVITKPEAGTAPFYVNGKVNVGNTNGKVILQTFSLESLKRVAEFYEGKVPMCFLFWYGTGATDLKNETPLGYASFINLGVQYKAHIIGPSIAGAPNNYYDTNKPWQAYLIRKSGMLNHPYSFDTRAQMDKYYGEYNFGNTEKVYPAPYLDAMFTNRAEMTCQYFIDRGVRPSPAPQTVPNSEELLIRLGYTK